MGRLPVQRQYDMQQAFFAAGHLPDGCAGVRHDRIVGAQQVFLQQIFQAQVRAALFIRHSADQESTAKGRAVLLQKRRQQQQRRQRPLVIGRAAPDHPAIAHDWFQRIGVPAPARRHDIGVGRDKHDRRALPDARQQICPARCAFMARAGNLVA